MHIESAGDWCPFLVQVACALYEAAIAKFEAVLEADPGNRPVLRNCALALFDLARLQPDPTSRAARQLLEVSYISAWMSEHIYKGFVSLHTCQGIL
jgi:hypothetical protein